MGLLIGTKRTLLGGAKKETYAEKVLGYDPIAYWPLWEASGGVAECLVNSAQNGAYTGVTLGQPGIGDGRTAPFFDGANDFTNIYTGSFRDAFALYNDPTGMLDESEGTAMIWAKVANAGVWTDGVERIILSLRVNEPSRINFIKTTSVTGRLIWHYSAANVSENIVLSGLTTVDRVCLGITWSKSTGGTGEVLAYYNGVQTGVAQVGLGVWIGQLSSTQTLIGASATTPTNPWHGWLAHCAVYGRALSPAAMADLAVV